MKGFQLNIPRRTKTYIKYLWLPSLSIFLVVILSVTIFRQGYFKINVLRNNLSQSRKDQAILEEKIGVLKEIKDNRIINSDITYVTLPGRNPAPWLVSQVRALSETHGLNLVSFGVDDPDSQKIADSNLITAEFDTELSSKELTPIINFLLDFRHVAPIINIEGVRIEIDNNGAFTADTRVSVYWSTLPQSLPLVTDAIDSLNSKDQEILRQIVGLKKPVFSELDPQGPSDRENPFD